MFHKPNETERIDNLYMYYRGQTIIARKVLKVLGSIDQSSAEHIFTAKALQHVLELYSTFKAQSEKKMNDLALAYPETHNRLSRVLPLKVCTRLKKMLCMSYMNAN